MPSTLLSQARPSVGAHIGVKDEIDLIAAMLAHLRGIGIAEIVVHDMQSTDGTREWLENQDLRVIDSPQGASEENLIALFGETVKSMSSTWVLMLDADEFPLPWSGDLRHDLAEVQGDIVTLRRHNVALGPQGALLPLPVTTADYSHIPLYIRRDPAFAKTLDANPVDYWLRGVPNPKVAVRPGRLERFAPGMHQAFTVGASEAPQAVPPEVIVAHLALTSYDRFARKIDNIRAMFNKQGDTFPKGFGWHWYRWVQLAERGELRAEYDRSICFESDLARLKAEGALASAEDVLNGLG